MSQKAAIVAMILGSIFIEKVSVAEDVAPGTYSSRDGYRDRIQSGGSSVSAANTHALFRRLGKTLRWS